MQCLWETQFYNVVLPPGGHSADVQNRTQGSDYANRICTQEKAFLMWASLHLGNKGKMSKFQFRLSLNELFLAWKVFYQSFNLQVRCLLSKKPSQATQQPLPPLSCPKTVHVFLQP